MEVTYIRPARLAFRTADQPVHALDPPTHWETANWSLVSDASGKFVDGVY